MRRSIELLLAALAGAAAVLIFLALRADPPPPPRAEAEQAPAAPGDEPAALEDETGPEVALPPSPPRGSRAVGSQPLPEAREVAAAAPEEVRLERQRLEEAHQQAEMPPEAPGQEDNAAAHREALVIQGSSGVIGLARIQGEVPPPRRIDTISDGACTQLDGALTIRDVEAQGELLAGVFVYVASGLPAGRAYPLRTERVILDQRGCQFRPRLVGLQVGQPLEIVNSDPLLHNVHAYARPGEFNQAMPRQGQRIMKTFKAEQVLVPVRCEVHHWMQAWVGVVAHPYFAVTGADGVFAIPDLPPGQYELALVHPTLGTRRVPFGVVPGAATQLDVVFQPNVN